MISPPPPPPPPSIYLDPWHIYALYVAILWYKCMRTYFLGNMNDCTQGRDFLAPRWEGRDRTPSMADGVPRRAAYAVLRLGGEQGSGPGRNWGEGEAGAD